DPFGNLVRLCRRRSSRAEQGRSVMAAQTAWFWWLRHLCISRGAIGLALAQLAVVGWLWAAPAIADDDVHANRIRIEYEAPHSSELQPLYELVKQREVLQTIQEIFSPLKLPIDIIVQAKECGVSNAWYQRPNVIICYEYLL